MDNRPGMDLRNFPSLSFSEKGISPFGIKGRVGGFSLRFICNYGLTTIHQGNLDALYPKIGKKLIEKSINP